MAALRHHDGLRRCAPRRLRKGGTGFMCTGMCVHERPGSCTHGACQCGHNYVYTVVVDTGCVQVRCLHSIHGALPCTPFISSMSMCPCSSPMACRCMWLSRK